MDAVKALKQVFIFKNGPEQVLEVVAQAAEETSVPAGHVLFSSAETPNALFVIRNGTVRLLAEDGKTPPVLFGTGETVGEMLLIDRGPAGGTATALERADLFVIKAGRLDEALAGHPEAGYQLYRAIAKSLAGRLRRAIGMLAFASERQDR
jgi:CRP-like cAMP-binding protein